jgi:hypothetical protein
VYLPFFCKLRFPSSPTNRIVTGWGLEIGSFSVKNHTYDYIKCCSHKDRCHLLKYWLLFNHPVLTINPSKRFWMTFITRQ